MAGKKIHWTQYKKMFEELEKENFELKEKLVLMSKKEDQRKTKPHYSTYKFRNELLMKENAQCLESLNELYCKVCDVEKATYNLLEVKLDVVF